MGEKLFNHEEKMEFLETIDNDDIKNIYEHLFSKSKSTEILLKKDLYSFSLNQIEKVIYNLNPSTMNSALNNRSRINNYITWAIRNGRRANNINPIQGTTTKWARKFIDKTVKRHLSDVELYDLLENLYNAQDQALIQCIYEGIQGQGFSELLSMRSSKIDWDNNIITVFDQKYEKEREVKVTNRCMRYIENAYKEKPYVSEEAEVEKELIDHEDYIFKNTKWKASIYETPNTNTLTKRIRAIKNKYEFNVFQAESISESGRIKMAADIIKNNNLKQFGKNEFEVIGDRYKLTKIRTKDYSYYNTTKMKEYINSDNLKKLYNIEVDIV